MNFFTLPHLEFVQAMTSLMAPGYRERQQAPETLRPVRRKSRS